MSNELLNKSKQTNKEQRDSYKWVALSISSKNNIWIIILGWKEWSIYNCKYTNSIWKIWKKINKASNKSTNWSDYLITTKALSNIP